MSRKHHSAPAPSPEAAPAAAGEAAPEASGPSDILAGAAAEAPAPNDAPESPDAGAATNESDASDPSGSDNPSDADESADAASSDDASDSAPAPSPEAAPAAAGEAALKNDAGEVLVIPLDGFYINGIPHTHHFAEPEQAERHVASGAFRYGNADDLAAIEAEAAVAEAEQSDEGDADQA